MEVKISNKMIQLKKDSMDDNFTIESFYCSDDLVHNDLYIFIDGNDDVFMVDANRGRVYDLPYYVYASRNVLIDCVNDLNDGKVLKCKRLKHIEKEVLNKFYGKKVTQNKLKEVKNEKAKTNRF